MKPFDYSHFESQFMDRDYIQMLQRPRVRFFRGCRNVLDLACGPGFFLELLKEANIEAVGIDRNEAIVEKVLQKNLRIIRSDVLGHLEATEEQYDGIFCSHLVEHLSFQQVTRLVELITLRLNAGGVLVMVFPNPGSIRLHLFGFWRDPEHVRFYNGDLIASVCRHYGLTLEYSNEAEEPNRVEAPRLAPLSFPPPVKGWKAFFQKGKEPMESVVQEFNQRIETFNQEMERFSEALNKMWSRDDEVVLAFRKGERP